MGAHVGAGLQHIEETLHRIALLVQVVVPAPAGRLPGLQGHGVEQRLIDPLELGLGPPLRLGLIFPLG
jgi:hypothetical protein